MKRTRTIRATRKRQSTTKRTPCENLLSLAASFAELTVMALAGRKPAMAPGLHACAPRKNLPACSAVKYLFASCNGWPFPFDQGEVP